MSSEQAFAFGRWHFSSRRLMLLVGVTSAGVIPRAVLAGGGGPTLATTANQLYVDDFSTTGVVNAQYTVPSTGTYALTQTPITAASGSSQLKLSADGSALVFDAYNAPVGTTSAYSSPNLERGVGIVSGTGAIDTTTQFAGTNGTPLNNALWLGGTNPILAAAGQYSVTPDTQTTSTPATNFFFPNGALPGAPVVGNYFGGHLYVTSNTVNNSASPKTYYFGVDEINGSTPTQLPGFPSSGAPLTYSDFVMTDADSANPYGFDTIYLATGSGLQKWAYSGSTYSNVWTIPSNATTMGFAADPTNTFIKSLVMTTDGQGDNILYGVAVDGTVKGAAATQSTNYDDTYLVELTDPDSSTSASSDVFTDLSSSAPDVMYAGVAFAPTGSGFGTGDLAVLVDSVPEPTSLGLIGVVATMSLRRRRGTRD